MRVRYWRRAPVVLLVFLQCGPWPLLLQTKLLGAESDGGQAVNLAVFIEGQVSVKRKGWTGFAPVVFGTSLRRGDLLHLDESSHAKVVCSDLTLRDISPAIVGVPCEGARSVLRRPDGSMINATRSWPSDGSFPAVLSPRMTKLLSPRPVLRWTPVKGTTNYQVIVRGINFYWSRVYSGTEITYPDREPALGTGVDYKLIVETIGPNSRSSSEEPGLGLGFSVLSSTERKLVLEEQKQLEHLGLEEGPTQYLIGHLYASHGLNAEAIQRLEAVAKKFQVPATERLLGELYLTVALPRQAEAHYLKSLELSQKEQDDEGQMQCRLVLGTIYSSVFGNSHAAGEHLEAAIEIAGKIGDDVTIGEARKQLSELK
jgi:hypothetical protein